MCHSTMTVCLNTSMLFYKVQEKKIKHQKPLIKLTLGLELPDTINCWKQAKVGLAARSCGGQRSNCGCALSGSRVGLFWRPAADSDSGSPSNTKRDSQYDYLDAHLSGPAKRCRLEKALLPEAASQRSTIRHDL